MLLWLFLFALIRLQPLILGVSLGVPKIMNGGIYEAFRCSM